MIVQQVQKELGGLVQVVDKSVEENKFKKGDRVEILDFLFKGEKGIVEEKFLGVVIIKLDNGDKTTQMYYNVKLIGE